MVRGPLTGAVAAALGMGALAAGAPAASAAPGSVTAVGSACPQLARGLTCTLTNPGGRSSAVVVPAGVTTMGAFVRGAGGGPNDDGGTGGLGAAMFVWFPVTAGSVLRVWVGQGGGTSGGVGYGYGGGGGKGSTGHRGGGGGGSSAVAWNVQPAVPLVVAAGGGGGGGNDTSGSSGGGGGDTDGVSPGKGQNGTSANSEGDDVKAAVGGGAGTTSGNTGEQGLRGLGAGGGGGGGGYDSGSGGGGGGGEGAPVPFLSTGAGGGSGRSFVGPGVTSLGYGADDVASGSDGLVTLIPALAPPSVSRCGDGQKSYVAPAGASSAFVYAQGGQGGENGRFITPNGVDSRGGSGAVVAAQVAVQSPLTLQGACRGQIGGAGFGTGGLGGAGAGHIADGGTGGGSAGVNASYQGLNYNVVTAGGGGGSGGIGLEGQSNPPPGAAPGGNSGLAPTGGSASGSAGYGGSGGCGGCSGQTNGDGDTGSGVGKLSGYGGGGGGGGAGAPGGEGGNAGDTYGGGGGGAGSSYLVGDKDNVGLLFGPYGVGDGVAAVFPMAGQVPFLLPASIFKFNNSGIGGVPNGPNFDGYGSYFDPSSLTKAGLAPGNRVRVGDVFGYWPNVPTSENDNWVPRGQTISLAGVGSTLVLVGTASNGPATASFTVHFDDGSTFPVTTTFADWQSKTPAAGTNAFATRLRLDPGTGRGSLWSTTVRLPAGKQAVSLTFAAGNPNPTAPTVHVFVAALGGPDNHGISAQTGSSTPNGSFDGDGNSYSPSSLSAAGLTPAAAVKVNGTTLTWPDYQDPFADNYTARSQTIPLDGSGRTLAVLAAAANGDVTDAQARVFYSDGSSTVIIMQFADWASSQPLPGTSTVATVRNNSGTPGYHVYGATYPLSPGKTPTAITLPGTIGGPAVPGARALHIFAVGTGGT